MDKVSLAIVGLGMIGKRHLQALSEVTEAELVAIVDTNPKTQENATVAGVDYFATTEEMLLRAKPDGVMVCTPTEHHLQPVLDALRANVHVFVEKPDHCLNE